MSSAPPIAIDMLDRSQHVPFYPEDCHAKDIGDFLVGVSLHPAQEEYFQRARLQLLKDSLEVFELLAANKRAVLVIFSRFLLTLFKLRRQVGQPLGTVNRPIAEQICRDRPEEGLWCMHLGPLKRAVKLGERLLGEILRIILRARPLSEETDQPGRLTLVDRAKWVISIRRSRGPIA
jgi:hypothetical protein